MHTLKILPICLCFVLYCAGANAKTAHGNYARIMILNYANRTNNPDFEYLSASFGDATREAMRGRFEFREIANSDQTLLANPDDEIAHTIGASVADVLILGSFERTTPLATVGQKRAKKQGEALRVAGKVYSIRHQKIIAEYSRTTTVDARIFNTVGEIAHEAVRSIRDYTRKINAESAVIDGAKEKEPLTLERLKLKVFVPPIF